MAISSSILIYIYIFKINADWGHKVQQTTGQKFTSGFFQENGAPSPLAGWPWQVGQNLLDFNQKSSRVPAEF